MSTDSIRIGVIGGSGLYQMPQLTDIEELDIDTPFGKPSDAIIAGKISGVQVAFIPRHGRGHTYMPGEVPYRANIYALKSLGVERVIAVSACGSLREDYAPGHIVIPDGLFDHTKDQRGRTFFGEGLVAHIGIADSFCADLSAWVGQSVRASGGHIHEGGAYITVEGPRFSTRAESNVYRGWGMSIIGMTTSPEAYLAREAEMCYAVMAHVTDYDVWHESEEAVTVEMVIKTMGGNLDLARNALADLIPRIVSEDRTCACGQALEHAILTARDKIAPETVSRLGVIVSKYLK
jgi:5'-methylthioadenosine phosphorylase